MDRKKPDVPPTTEVEIFGAVYHVRGRDDDAYLREVATLVDGKMREVAERVSTVDAARIAILAAMNIADELCQCRKRQEGERVEIKEKAAALEGELAAVLDGEMDTDRNVAYG